MNWVAVGVGLILANQILFAGGAVYAAKKVQAVVTELDMSLIQDLFFHWFSQTTDHAIESWREFAEQWGGHIEVAGDWIRWAWDFWSEEELTEDEQWWEEEWAWGATNGWLGWR